MKRGVLSLTILEVFFFAAGTFGLLTFLIERTTATNCNPIRSYVTLSPGACNNIYKSERDYITYPGGAQFNDVVAGFGQCAFGRECWPQFKTPTVTQTSAIHGTAGIWEQTVYNYSADSTSCYFISYIQVKIPSSGYTCCDPGYVLTGSGCVAESSGGNCTTAGWNGDCPPGTEPDGYGWCCAAGGCGGVAQSKDSSAENPSPNIANPSCCDDYQRLQCYQGGGEWYESQCACYSPVVIDVAGNGFDLTNAANGVMFDLPGAGVTERLSWTSANSDDAWLALDRNGNGIIDNGKELFGTFTAQPALSPRESKNGFRALAMFDTPAYGGNADGQIDTRDAIFSNLRLWQDRNHNGFSEGEELQNLSASVLRVIELTYKESRRRDENGNWFHYRARVRDERGAQAGRWAWDVFLQKPH
jgi:hypothetical protein